MPAVLNSKKVIISLVGVLVVFVLALVGRDIELIKWVGGFVTGIVSTLNIGQGIADGMSRGATSASTAPRNAGQSNTTGNGTSRSPDPSKARLDYP